MKIKLTWILSAYLRLVERSADAIYLSNTETTESAQKAYQRGKADLAQMQKDLENK